MGEAHGSQRSLSDAVNDLKQQFDVGTETLNEICDRFQQELEDGLREDGSNIPMNITWVQGLPTGKETGEYLAVDLGGTNIRVCWIKLLGEGKETSKLDATGDEANGQAADEKTEVRQQHYEIGEEIKTGTANELWEFVASSIETFIKDEDLASGDTKLSLGFTFSYPATQERIDHGILQTWTKGFDIDGVEGEDVVGQLNDAMKKKNLPVKLVALVNDTTGALIASHYNDPETIIGAIFGTGCNAAYMETAKHIPKLKGKLPDDTPMAINCEYGAFDNGHNVLPRTTYDETIDKESPRPGEQTFEKMSAGLYLGEIYRLILIELNGRDLLFSGQDLSQLQEPYSLDTSFLSGLENDETNDLKDSRKHFTDMGISPSTDEVPILRELAEMVTIRAARLCACGVAAIARKKNLNKGHIAADGSVANKHPKFKQRWSQAMGEVLGWKNGETPIIMTSAEDGSGVGAAVISAMAQERGW